VSGAGGRPLPHHPEEAPLRERPLGSLARPLYAGRSLPNLGASVFHSAARSPGPGAIEGLAAPLARDRDPLEGRAPEGPIVLLLIDGLGWNAFRRALENGSGTGARSRWLPRGWIDRARPLTSVFPSTTTCALTSLSTATPPGQNGVVGHREYLPRWGVVADLLRMAPSTTGGTDTLIGKEWDRRSICPVPTLFERGLRADVVSRDQFEGSGFTRMIYQGARYRGYATASQFAAVLTETLARPDPPEAVFAYWDELDTSHHILGPDPDTYGLELERIAHLLEAVARRLEPAQRRRTQLWITGDHGLVEAKPEVALSIDEHPELAAALRHPPAGDRRATWFEVDPGERSEFEGRLRERLPSGSMFLSFEDAYREGLFGPGPHLSELRWRTGNLLALPAVPGGIGYHAPGATRPRRPLRGAHGGLDPEELWVPLITGSVDELVPS
jgi:hypothetical protein